MRLLLPTFTIIFVSASLTLGQQIQPTALAGEWQGVITSKVKGSSARGSISVYFRGGQEVSIGTPEQEEGTFVVEGDSIVITPKDTPKDLIRLNHVLIQGDTLHAELVVASDPPGISNTVELSKLTAQRRAMSAQSRAVSVCADLDLPQGVKKLFEKYEIDCPIKVPGDAPYYELAFYRHLLSEVVRELSGRTYEITYAGGKFQLLAPNAERAREAYDIIVPLLQDPGTLEVSIIGAPRCPPPFRCALEFLDVRELKPEYVSGDRIDFNRVWSKVVEVAESKNVRFVATNRDASGWSAQTGDPALVAQNQNGYFYEKISVLMTDEYADDNSRRGTYLRLLVKSEIWQKKAASVKRALKIEDQCSVGTSSILDYTCSDKSIMDDIIKAISNVVRGI